MNEIDKIKDSISKYISSLEDRENEVRYEEIKLKSESKDIQKVKTTLVKKSNTLSALAKSLDEREEKLKEKTN